MLYFMLQAAWIVGVYVRYMILQLYWGYGSITLVLRAVNFIPTAHVGPCDCDPNKHEPSTGGCFQRIRAVKSSFHVFSGLKAHVLSL